jgi:hypothetical protein
MGRTCDAPVSHKLRSLISMQYRFRRTLHILRRSSAAHFEVVWPHEQVGDAFAHHPQDPLIKVLGLCFCHLICHFGVDEARQTLDLQSTADKIVSGNANAGVTPSNCLSKSVLVLYKVVWCGGAPDPRCPGR